MKKNFIFLLFLLSNLSFIEAQDIHFSHFNENPSLINPALMGQEYKIKASIIYKDQWRSVTVPYTTFGADVEMRFNQKNSARGGRSTSGRKKLGNIMSAGLSFFSDKAGDGNMGTTLVNLSLAASIPVTRNSSLALGLQASMVQRKIDYSKLIWPDQYTGAGYDQNMQSGEDITAGNFTYPDFAAGLLYSNGYVDNAIGSNDQFKMDIGFSMYHFSKPKLSYLEATEERMFTKEIIHGRFIFGVSDRNITILPSYLIQFQGPSIELIVGSMVRYAFKADSKYTGNLSSNYLSLGLFYRNKDAFIARAQFDLRQFAFGFGYDINTSQLKTASSIRGGFEVFVRFNSRKGFLYQ